MEDIRLMPHQVDAVERMESGKILCGGTGSGKSLTSLFFYKKNYSDLPLYIITVAIKRDNKEWEEELAKIGLTATVIDSWNNIKKYNKVKNAFFIFDEDKVTGSGIWAKTFISIARQNKWIILSATPGDCYNDYWAVFVARGFYRNKTEFAREHIIYNPWVNFPQIKKYIGTGKLNAMLRETLVVMEYERRTVQHHKTIVCRYDTTKYRFALEHRKNPYTFDILENVSQLCYVLRYVSNTDTSREIALIELLGKHRKCIIFYSFDYELEIIKRICDECKIPYSERNGHKHDAVPTGDIWVYIVNYASGAEAWNCITCDTVIFYSQTYSYKTRVQSAGRIDRANTPFTDLYYYHLRSASPIDIEISKCLTRKRTFNESRYFKKLNTKDEKIRQTGQAAQSPPDTPFGERFDI